MKRYEQIKQEENIELEETRSVEKPKPEAGYEIKRAMVRDPKNPRRLVKGWVKTPKVKKSKVRGMSKAQRKKAARKAARTRKKDIRGQRIAKKKAKLTRKKSKQAGLIK